jgi:hypothetical protein
MDPFVPVRTFGFKAIIGLICASALVVPLCAAAAGDLRSAPPATQPSAAEEATIRWIQCVGNLHKIYLGIVTYADRYKGLYPRDLGTVMVAEKLDMSTFVCPAAPKCPTRSLAKHAAK